MPARGANGREAGSLEREERPGAGCQGERGASEAGAAGAELRAAAPAGHLQAERRAAGRGVAGRTMPTFDQALRKAGEFGRFQRRVFLLLCLTGVTFAFLFVGVVFLGSQPDYYWCRGPRATELAERCSWSPEEEWNLTAPELRTPAERRGQGHCHRYLLEAINASPELSCDPLAAFPNRSAPLVPCSGDWRYVETHSTIVSQVSVALCSTSPPHCKCEKVATRLGLWSLHDVETPLRMISLGDPLGSSACLQLLYCKYPGKSFVYVPVPRLRDIWFQVKIKTFLEANSEMLHTPAPAVVTEMCWHSD